MGGGVCRCVDVDVDVDVDVGVCVCVCVSVCVCVCVFVTRMIARVVLIDAAYRALYAMWRA